MRRDEAYALDVLNAAKRAIEVTEGLTAEGFARNRTVHEAALYSLLIMGEAAGRLSPEFRERMPEVPRRQVTGLRNRLIHEYGSTDLELVWNLIRDDLPGLVTALEGKSAQLP